MKFLTFNLNFLFGFLMLIRDFYSLPLHNHRNFERKIRTRNIDFLNEHLKSIQNTDKLILVTNESLITNNTNEIIYSGEGNWKKGFTIEDLYILKNNHGRPEKQAPFVFNPSNIDENENGLEIIIKNKTSFHYVVRRLKKIS